MNQTRIAILLALTLFVSAGISATRALPPPPEEPLPTVDASVVVRLYVRDRDHLNAVAGELDLWEAHPKEGYVVAAVTPAQYRWLESLGYRLEIDAEKTAPLEIRAALDPRYYYFDDYYTNPNGLYVVDFLQDVNAAYPGLTELYDIGDAWMAGQIGEHDRDLWVLRITNEHPAYGPIADKPAFFLFATIHAREVAIPELAIRYVKYLTEGQGGEGGYGVDPDVTWLVNHSVAYVLVMQNPDGHWKNERNTSNYRRKNMDWDDGCPYPGSWGVDLNRNHSFLWNCCGGSSSNPCSETYRGPSRGSEPETQAFENYFATVMRDQNGPNGDDEIPPAAPITTTGIFISLHSYSDLVLWPWGFDDYGNSPNYAQLRTIGRKFAHYNGYDPSGSIWYDTDGTTDDWTYGKFGIPSYTFEVGSWSGACGGFFPPYDCIDGYAGRNFWAENKPAFLYAHKIARTPYVTAYGPDAEALTVAPGAVPQSAPVQLTATIADHRYSGDPLQPITAAEYFIDAPGADGSGIPMAPADGAWGGLSEQVTATVDTSGLALGRHYFLVHGQNDDGDWGPFTAVFVTVLTPTYTVALTPATATRTGNPGESATYTLTVTNLGNVCDTYALALSGHVWMTTLSITTTGEIAPLGSADVQVTVDVPLSAGQSDTVTVTATSQGDGTVSASSVLTTTTACVPVSGAHLAFAPVAPLVGQTVTFTGSVVAGTPPITWEWGFGDGESGSGPVVTHTYTASDTYNVVMTATNACPSQDTATHNVVVTGEPDIEVIPPALSATLNPGDAATRTLTVGNTGTAGLNWSLAESPAETWLTEVPMNGVVAPADRCDMAVIFDATDLSNGVYTTTLRLTSDDPDEPQVNVSAALTVTTACIPVSGADLNFAPAALIGQTFILTGAVTSGTPPITYTWDFGDGSTPLTTGGSTPLTTGGSTPLTTGGSTPLTTGGGAAQVGNPITHTFPLTVTAQTYTVTMTAANGCPSQDTASKAVTVYLRYLLFPIMRNYSP